MFYQTPPSSFSPFTSHSSQVEEGMRRIVKGGLTPKMILEDVSVPILSSFSPNSVVVGEDLFVDQLLNLNYDEQQHEEETQQLVLETQPQQQQQHKDSVFLEDNDVPFLKVPAEEADLEWLSQFVEETESSPFSTPFPPNYARPNPNPEPEHECNYVTTQPLALSRSRRRKRARIGGPDWVTSLYEAETSSSTTNSPPRLGPYPVPSREKMEKKVGGLTSRRCSHCGVTKTPQWRAGPTGAKTLCNACGVRYKSGRLYPEYRPAGSPEFESEKYSNCHKKVLEMREKKMGRVMGGSLASLGLGV